MVRYRPSSNAFTAFLGLLVKIDQYPFVTFWVTPQYAGNSLREPQKALAGRRAPPLTKNASKVAIGPAGCLREAVSLRVNNA